VPRATCREQWTGKHESRFHDARDNITPLKAGNEVLEVRGCSLFSMVYKTSSVNVQPRRVINPSLVSFVSPRLRRLDNFTLNLWQRVFP